MDSLETQSFDSKTVHLRKKKDLLPLKEANNSKEIQVELLLKDIKAAALKRVNLISEKENKNKVLEDSHNENISLEEESKPKVTDQNSFLSQSRNSCIYENLIDSLDNKNKQLENGVTDKVISYTDENKHFSIYDNNITANIIHSSDTSKDSSLQNGEISSSSPDITYSEADDQKDIDHFKSKENDQNANDNIFKQNKLLSNNEVSTDMKITENVIKNGESSVLINGTAEKEEISPRLIKTVKHDSQKEPTSQTSVKEIGEVKVIEEIIQENNDFKDFTNEPILSADIATQKQLNCIEIMADKEPMDSENDDKNSSPNFTSSVSEEEDPSEEGICIIINGKRLPPSSESELESLRNSKEKLSPVSDDEIDLNQSSNSVFESVENSLDVTETSNLRTNTSHQESTNQQNSFNHSKFHNKTDILSAILDMTNKTKSGKTTAFDRPDTLTKNEKYIRPIIHNFLGDATRKPVRTQSLNIKSVTFSQDTVFNEDKTKRYRKERVSLRNVYRGRINNSETYAKVNPLFEDDSDEGEGYVTKGNNQSSHERRGSFIYHGDNKTSPTSDKSESDSPIDVSILLFLIISSF